MDKNDRALQDLLDTVAATSATLASRMTIAMAVAGMSPNRMAEWLRRYTPMSPSFDPQMAERINKLILDRCLHEIELYDKLKGSMEGE
jgi:hypothetical protein